MNFLKSILFFIGLTFLVGCNVHNEASPKHFYKKDGRVSLIQKSKAVDSGTGDAWQGKLIQIDFFPASDSEDKSALSLSLCTDSERAGTISDGTYFIKDDNSLSSINEAIYYIDFENNESVRITDGKLELVGYSNVYKLAFIGEAEDGEPVSLSFQSAFDSFKVETPETE